MAISLMCFPSWLNSEFWQQQHSLVCIFYRSIAQNIAMMLTLYKFHIS
jgi:hypothetical protein